MNSQPAITVDHVSKSFGTLRAVDDVSVTVHEGDILALLGPNGAGKTTLLDMVLGMTAPSAGSIEVCGTSPARAIQGGHVGAMFQTAGLLGDLTVEQTVRMIAGCHRRHLPVRKAMQAANLEGIARRKVRACSGGQKQRLRFALALLPDPSVLILDEPTTGMDVTARHVFWEAMHEQASLGRTIIFATHFLPEAEAFAQRIILMREGRIHMDRSASDLARGSTVTVSMVPTGETTVEQYAHLLGVDEGDIDISSAPARVSVSMTEHSPVSSDEVVRRILTHGLGREMRIQQSSLDELFLELTNHEGDSA